MNQRKHNGQGLIIALGITLLSIAAIPAATGQAFYRFKAAFSIKEKARNEEKGSLITGTVYCDKNLHKIAYHVKFPTIETWFIADTNMVRIAGDSVKSSKIAPIGEYSFFNLILNQQLSDFGLSKSGFVPGEVTNEGDQVLSQWLPPEQLKTYLGPVVLAQQQKRLVAVAFYNPEEKLVSKMYLQDYQVINGLSVPGKIYQIYYKPEGDVVRIMSFKEIQIDQTDEQEKYDFVLPDNKG